MTSPVLELEFLQRLAPAAASTLDAGELVRLVVAETTGATATDVCSLWLLEADERHLVLAATNGLSQAGVGRVRLRLGEGVTGWAGDERRPVVVVDVRAEPRFRWLPGVDQARYVSMCSVPMVSGDRLVGVLNVQTDARRDFGARDVAFLSAIAAQVAGVLERSELQGRLEARLAERHRSDEIHRRFCQMVISGSGMTAICAAIQKHAGALAAVYDDEGTLLAAGKGVGLPGRLDVTAGGKPADELTVVPIQAGRDLLGWLAVAPAPEADPAGRRLALEHGVTVLALHLTRERAAAEAESRVRGDLLEELLSGRVGPGEAGRLAERAARLGCRIHDPSWVVVMEPDGPESGRLLATPTPRRRAIRALTDLVRASPGGGLVAARAGGLTVLVGASPGLAAVERLARAATVGVAAAAGGGSFSCGLSARAAGPADLHRGAEEARLALRVARRLHQRGSVTAFSRLGIERLLAQVAEPEHLSDYVAHWLGPLLTHARAARAAPLIETLEALCAESWNLRATGRRLAVHVNTVLYRMDRIERLGGYRLDDVNVRLALATALRVQALVAGIEDPPSGRPAWAVRAPRPPGLVAVTR